MPLPWPVSSKSWRTGNLHVRYPSSSLPPVASAWGSSHAVAHSKDTAEPKIKRLASRATPSYTPRGSFLHQPGRGGYVRVSLVSSNPCVGGTTARELSSSGARHCRRTVLMVAGSYGTDKEHDGYRRGIACSVEGETVDNPKDLRLLLNWSKCTTS
jgi:hypothetical protein